MSERRELDVEVQITLNLVIPDSGPVPLQVALSYSAVDPYAVRAAFRGTDTTVEWVFARELLLHGLDEATGVGDVHVWPTSEAGTDLVHISLTSPDGRAVLEAEAGDLRRFLDATVAVVPVGSEEVHLDLDQVIARLSASS